MSTSASHLREKSGGSVRSSLRRNKEAAPPAIAIPTTMPESEAGPSTTRRVRTVPPSAAYEPSTPPSPARPSNDSTLVDPLALPDAGKKRERRPRPKLRYSTSESSWDDVDDVESDDEPPWWTFTNRGMHKMKLRTMRHQEAQAGGSGQPTDDSGKEGRARSFRKPNKRFPNSRPDGSQKRSNSGPGEGGDGKEEKKKKRPNTANDPTPRSSVKNMRISESPKPMRPPLALPPNMRMSTPAFLRSRKDTGTPPAKIKMKRRYSAPSSPVPDDPIPSIGMITSTADGPALPVPLHGSLPIPAVAHSHSFLPIPRPPFMKRHSESMTDTEAVASQSVRLKAKRAQSSVKQNETSQQDSGTSTPMRRHVNVRKQTMSKLKLNLPDNVTQHFTHGWPHAGSWQDALYGYYDEVPKEKDNSSRRSSKDVKARSGSLPPQTLSPTQIPVIMTPRMEAGSDSTSTPATPPVRRGKSKRRKYRPAIAPPTPSGLGFTAAEKGQGRHDESWKQGRITGDGFDWGNGHLNANGSRHGHDRITEEGDLSINRTETRQTVIEKAGVLPQKVAEKVKRKVSRNDGLDWKQRLRRKMFLDARVTIWIRFINLAVVVCSLGLAITIRKELFSLNLPGLIGPSTTLVIAYSCLTTIHIFIAVYREYFGRPIGLWGLRSKMLWVCLDLLFVALWSSALTLQINDLIDTPLDCVAQSAWWEEGQSAQYAGALNTLRESDANLRDLEISPHLGLILPDEITGSDLARAACRRQEGGIALALMTLLLYGGNMVLSLFRIFETVRRTAHVDRAVMY